jgi:FkbM family methyltransferase
METSAPVQRFEPVPRISYAQNMEDILLDRVFRGRQGTFIDIGANHPFIDSNTYFFYLRGWRGLNIDPLRRGHELFQKYRPEDLNLAVAASDAEGTLPFFEICNAEGLTGLSTVDSRAAAAYRTQGFEVRESTVVVRTVESLIAEYHIEPPELVSIDVEGHEAAVLRGMPLAHWRPKVLVIESTAPLSSVATHRVWEPALFEYGYRFATFNGINRFYLRDDLEHELPKFETPVNALDGFQRHETLAYRDRAAEYLRQADQERDRYDRELAVLRNQVAEERARYEREHAARAEDRARFEEVRTGWEWGRVQLQYIYAVCEQEIARIGREREEWKARLADFELARSEWDRQRASYEHERVEHHRLLALAQAQLHPYQRIDRGSLIPAGYHLAHAVKRRLMSRS